MWPKLKHTIIQYFYVLFFIKFYHKRWAILVLLKKCNTKIFVKPFTFSFRKHFIHDTKQTARESPFQLKLLFIWEKFDFTEQTNTYKR